MNINRERPADKASAAFPLSPYQHREWVLWRLADGRSARVVTAARKLCRIVDESTIRGRLEKALQSCPVLRLAFDVEEPYAFVMSNVAVPLVTRYAHQEEDLSTAVSRITKESAQVPFSISDVPVLRATIVRARLGETEESALLFVAHAIIADEASLEYLLKKIDSDLDLAGVDEAFFSWSANFHSGEKQEEEGRNLAFYREFLNGASFKMDLPTDRARPPLFNAEGDFVEIEVPQEVQESIGKLAAKEKADPAVIVIAALSGYLGRLSRQSDIVMGLATDSRPAGCEAAIGPFENSAVLRVRLEDHIIGQHLIRQIRESLEELEPLQDFPFQALVRALEPDRDPSRTPIFQVHFSHRVREDDQAWLRAPSGYVISDLDVVLEERGHNLILRLGYRTDIFLESTVKNIRVHLIEVLKGLCAGPEEPVETLSVCTPQERTWILSTLNAQKTFPSESTIHGLVAAAAARKPESIAVSVGDVRLSYGKLNRRANQLAHRLRNLGVRRDVGVAVCMERSEEVIIALLAILKAGGAYVPIEPANPKERIEFVLADSKVHLILTEAAQKEKVAGASAQTIVLEPGGAAFASELTTDPEEVSDPHGLAYIIYTSGSTGRPKGVLIEHYNVVRLFQATQDWFNFDENDVWTMFHSVAFDFSVWEIWGALTYGGRLVIVPYLVSRSPEEFYELVAREKVTVLNQTPTAFRQLIQAEAEVGPRDLVLRLVIFGGEALEFESLRPWFERHGDQFPRLVNMYGITETCVHVTYRPISMLDLDSGQGASNIGLPIPDLSAYVVDESFELLPPGIPGELVVGGAGLARGYIERPELTKERFVPDPFSSEAGSRLYRSGDLVRLLPNGELDYLGRIDQQVNFRGFRIETGEIEAVLRRSGLLRDVAVMPWQSASNETLLVAYVVSDRPTNELREVARASLPEYMVPTYFVSVPEIPMTTNGKVDRNALPDPRAGGEGTSDVFVAPADELERIIADIWCEVLNVDQVSTHESFFDIGGTSLGVVRVATKLRNRLDRDISVVTLFQYTSVSALAKHLSQTEHRPESVRSVYATRPQSVEDEPIAIVGMAGRFQDADDIEALWNLLVNEKEAITFFKEEELSPTLDRSLITDPAYVKARGILADAESFDAAFFGMSRREAELTDPQQRVLMEVAWETLEHAGINPSSFPGLIATYAGVYNNSYYLENVLKRPDVLAQMGSFQAMVGNEKDFVATRIAHRLDLRGPALSIHTACSTSLVAVAQAFYALRTHQCDLALAGAAAVTCPQKSGYLYEEGGMNSPDGHTRPFDEKASGTVFSDGAAMVALCRLSDAIAWGSSIYALIRGVATNNDGGQRMSFSAPTVEGQAGVIARALSVAGVHPETIQYIEAHGTATPLGDPIEVEALKQAFGDRATKKNYCAVGSIKSNLGHLTAPSGVAGLIKVVLSINREQIPATLWFSRPNPTINFADSPFYVAAKLQPWPKLPGQTRRAGVSSFGVGGTNAHVVLEETSAQSQSGPSRTHQVLVLSAKTDSALEVMTAELAAYLEAHPELDLADVAFTLQRGRKPFAFRRSMVISSTAEAIARLRTPGAKSVFTGKAMKLTPSIVFLFPGQGAQHPDMGRGLYEEEVVFRREVDRCAEILQSHLELDLRSVLYPGGKERTTEEYQINETWLAQPAIFVVEYALAQLWMSWGVKPSVLIGHSIGEYAAAVLAGTFTLENALALISVRARLMQALPAGSMLAVRAGVEKIEPLLPEGTSIAAYNSPVLCVVSGPTEVMKVFQKELDSKEIVAKSLYTSHAFHSEMMEPMLPEFAVEAARIPARPPEVPWISTCTGRWMEAEDLAGGEYWVQQIRHPVRFAQGLEFVIGKSQNILLEVGPGQTLCQLARQHTKKSSDMLAIPTLGQVGEKENALTLMLAALGRLWIAGVDVSWEEFSANEKRRRVPLPTYPFERKRCWIEPPRVGAFTSQNAPQLVFAENTETNQLEETEMQAAHVSEQIVGPSRKERLISELRELFHSYSGEDHSQTDEEESFMDLGIDSLLLTQISQGVLKRFGVKVTFRQMLEDFSTLSTLASFLDEKLPPDALPEHKAPAANAAPPQHSPLPANPDAAMTAASAPMQLPPSGGGTLLETVIQQQMAIMSQQLELLRQPGPGGALPSLQTTTVRSDVAQKKPGVTAVNLDINSHFGPFKAIEKGPSGGLTERQQKALETLIKRYNRRTAKSKAFAQKHRAHFCDPRAAGNFRQLWKEMVYPIVCAKSKGSRIWDIDGNEYIDVTMGFGANYLGHSPDFVMKALKDQMKKGVEIGPQSPVAGEVAELICEFTGMDRATFCNTGSEAVMAAIRVSRTVTGREKIVYFYGDYHGIFDEVLGRPALVDGVPGAMPIALGIPPLPNVMVLEYGSPSSLEVIRKQADEIAAVIVEPVQSRHPDLQPRDFLKELRHLTQEKEIVLVIDEVITGFRIAPGGAQEYFGVKADLATYGKVVGGGMPIGVLAGSAAYMDALDGGFWQYGDDTSPPTGVTFFAGTFVRHPLAMAAAHAALTYLKNAGPSLQLETNERTAHFVERVNSFLDDRQLPMRLQKFSAIFYYDFHADLKYANLLFYYLRDRGIHIWEGRVGTLSVAHTDKDMERIQQAFQESIEEMQLGGFLPEADQNAVLRSSETKDQVEPVGSDPNGFPLAEAQHEMWIGAQMRPEAAGPHHACTGLYLDGELNLDLLRQAIREVVQRHKGLRCTFSVDGTEAILHPNFTPEVPVHDLSDLPKAEQKARVNEILHQEAQRLLDLTAGPLVDFQLLKLSARRHLLVFTAQMIVCDGWSHYVVFEDMGALYSALVNGSEPSLSPAVPMWEYARWEQTNEGTEEARECETFWMSQFETIPPPINLPTLHPRPPVRTFEGDRRELILSQKLYQDIKGLAKAQKNSYFAVLLAVFQVWLNRLSGVRDLVVGVPFAAQGQLGMDSLVGQCANILPLRNQLEPADLFTDVLRNTWSTVLDAQEHWNFTYGRVISQLDLPRDPSRIPLVSILFNIDPPMAKVKFSNLKHRFIAGPRYYFQYDLGFNLVEDEGTIRVECDYNRNMFDGEVVQNWVTSYQALLQAVVEKPDQPISTLPMLPGQQVPRLGKIEATEGTEGSSSTVPALIEAQAKRVPEKIAALCEGHSLTYQELDRRSTLLASHLRTLGIGPDSVVGICAEHSLHIPMALLSILKAGAAYVLMDPTSSKEDLAHILADANMRIVLASADAATCLPESSSRVLQFDQLTASELTGGDEVNSSSVEPENVACIVYKHGPDGKLIGVEITHRALVNFLLCMKQKPGVGLEDSVLCLTPLSSHVEAFELLLPLAVGAQTIIVPNASVLDPQAVASIIEKHEITAMQATPSAWRLLVTSGWKGNKRLKALCRDEALQPDFAKQLGRLCGEVWNIYGVVESTFAAIVGQVYGDVAVTLGDVVGNSDVVLVDELFEPVPVGVPGEILISGTALARGYRGISSLTAEKFVRRSVGGQAPRRFFRTGDLGRYRPNGKIEFIGRRASQVEICGSLIELADIEQILRKHASLQDVAVCFREDIGDKPGLVAYVSTFDKESAKAVSGRQKIARELGLLMRNAMPEYMRPSRVVVLEAMPRLANGEIDRGALPHPGQDDPELEDYAAPRNDTEEILAHIWQELLDLPKVNVKDSFFDLGGKSLLAVRLFVRIEQKLGRKLPLSTLFRAPSIEQLARLLTEEDGSLSKWPSLVGIQPKGHKPPLFLVHGAGGNVLLYNALAKQLEPDYPIYGLQSQGLDGQSEPLRTIEEMARYYLEEIREVQRKGPYLLGGYCMGGTIAYEMAQRLVTLGEEVAMVAMLDTYNFSRALKGSFFSFLLQKFKFHWGNFISLRPRIMWRYLREKKRIASDGGWAHIKTEMPGSTLQDGVARAESGAEASVQEINDHAGDIYDPKPYPGGLTLFKPHINYKFYPDPKMGWQDLALGGLDIIEMPINPHAMLVEPYVELLAKKLKDRLDRLGICE